METSDPLPSIPSRTDSSPNFRGALAELEGIVQKSVRNEVQWYQKHKSRQRILFWVSGATTIVLGSLIPFLSTYEGNTFRVTVAILGVLVAMSSGLNTFFRWQHNWQNYAAAQFSLEFLLHHWELTVAEARSIPDEARAIALIRSAAKELIEQTRSILKNEYEIFFHDEAPATPPKV